MGRENLLDRFKKTYTGQPEQSDWWTHKVDSVSDAQLDIIVRVAEAMDLPRPRGEVRGVLIPDFIRRMARGDDPSEIVEYANNISNIPTFTDELKAMLREAAEEYTRLKEQ